MSSRDRATTGSTARPRAELHLPNGQHRTDRPGPGGATFTSRAGRRRVDRPGLLLVTSQDVTILMAAHAPPPGTGVTGGDDVPRFG